MNPLLEKARKELMPRLREPVTVVDEGHGGLGALVILRLRDLRVQVTRDRGETRLDVGSMAQPHLMFDDQILREHFGLARDPDLVGATDLTSSLHAIAHFLNAHLDELSAMFSPARFAATRDALKVLQRGRVIRLFGEDAARG